MKTTAIIKTKNKASMKNIIASILTVACLLFASNYASAQYYPDIEYKKGDIEVALGFGLMNTFVDKNTEAPLPPISVNVHYRFKKTMSIGAQLGYSRTNYVSTDKMVIDHPNLEGMPEMSNNYFLAGLRFDGHYTKEGFDFYGGAMVGYNFSINNSDNLTPDNRLQNIVVEDYSDIVLFSGHIGAKYLITEHFGVYGEISGGGISIFNLGITTRF